MNRRGFLMGTVAVALAPALPARLVFLPPVMAAPYGVGPAMYALESVKALQAAWADAFTYGQGMAFRSLDGHWECLRQIPA